MVNGYATFNEVTPPNIEYKQIATFLKKRLPQATLPSTYNASDLRMLYHDVKDGYGNWKESIIQKEKRILSIAYKIGLLFGIVLCIGGLVVATHETRPSRTHIIIFSSLLAPGAVLAIWSAYKLNRASQPKAKIEIWGRCITKLQEIVIYAEQPENQVLSETLETWYNSLAQQSKSSVLIRT